MSRIEIKNRKLDGKWVRWELMDSHKPKISEPCSHAWYEGQPREEIKD